MKSIDANTELYFKFSHKFIHDGQHLEIDLIEYNDVTIEIKLNNLSYNDQRNAKLKLIGFLTVIALMYRIFVPWNPYIGVSLGVLLFIFCYQTTNLVKQDSVSFYGAFALQISTIYFLNFNSSLFVPANYLHDIIINEVISGFSIKYMLFARLQDEKCNKDSEYTIKPIIQLLPALSPGIDCLEIIYKHLRRKVEKSQESC